jgi:hypothetical protein
MIDLVLAVAVFSGFSPVPGSRPLPPPPPPPPVESVVLASASPAPVVTSTPSPAPPQAQQQEPTKESWAEKMWKRYTQNKGGQ